MRMTESYEPEDVEICIRGRKFVTIEKAKRVERNRRKRERRARRAGT
jgi:hypothetical protein